VLAVLVHVAIIALLVVSFRWSSDSTRPAPRTIQATALKEHPSDKPPKKDEPSQREIDEAKKREEAKKQAEAERKKREEAKRRAEAEKKRRAAEEAKKKDEAKRRAEAERKKREALAAQKRQEDERKKREAEQALRESLAAEEQARAESARAARAATEAEQYKAQIIQKVERNWNKPVDSKGLECVLKVRVVPGGEVVAVKVVQSSGNAMFDDSVQKAVWKATPLPLPPDPALFEYLREIEFTFRPSAG